MVALQEGKNGGGVGFLVWGAGLFEDANVAEQRSEGREGTVEGRTNRGSREARPR